MIQRGAHEARAVRERADFGEDAAGSREFSFTRSDFERIRKLIHGHAGISLSEKKQEMVYSRVARRVRATGAGSFKAYLDLLNRGDPAEWEAFTNALTTNLTAFFREAHHFPLLAEHALRCTERPLELWCAACSTGEEAYSMAIALAEAFGTARPPVRILATDVDTAVLESARAGIYSMARLESMEPARLKRWFQRGVGAQSGRARVCDELRALITFRQFNLLNETWPVRGPLQAIFCRNVMIYFDKATQRAVLERFTPLLRPSGLLFAGHSESFHHAADLLRLRGKTVYQPLPQAHAPARRAWPSAQGERA